jgi:ElaB/YqjD/DUF883 family membrane-anchored ribosome-binding protein
MSRLVKPIEYAKAQGISRQAVYAKIKKGLLSSKTVDGKIYIVLEEELQSKIDKSSSEEQEINSAHLIDVKELLNSKEQTITVLKESISDLKQTNTEINTTLRGEIELLKQVFTEMRNLYVKQVDYMNTEKKLELENKISANITNGTIYEEVVSVDEIPNDTEECWITLDEFLERSDIKKSKKRNKIKNRLKKAYRQKDKRIKIDNDEIFLSCYHFYEDILKR